MAESPYRQMSEQHIRRQAQYNSPVPVRLVHQPQAAGEQPMYQTLAGLVSPVQGLEQFRQQQALEWQRLGLIHQQQQ